ENIKRPCPSVVVVWEPCGPVSVTVAPGTARFCASIAWPVIVPVVCCAEATLAHMRTTIKTSVDDRIALSRNRTVLGDFHATPPQLFEQVSQTKCRRSV